MNIAFLLTSFNIGGIEKVFITLANELAYNNKVSLILCNNEGQLKSLVSEQINIIDLGNIKVTKLPTRLPKILKINHFDYFFSGSDLVNILVIISSLFVKIKTKMIVTQHNFFNSETKYIINKRITQKIMEILYNKADLVIAVSEEIRKFCKEILRCKKVIKIPNPIDLNKSKLLANEIIDVNDKKLPETFILFAGRFSGVKNLDFLIKAMNVVKYSAPEIKLILLGEGPEKKNIEQLITDLQLGNTITMLGSKSNVFPYIKNSKCVVLVSHSEAFPVILLEAFSLGVPVICTETMGAKEILQPLKQDYFVHTFDDYNELAKKIVDICSSNINKNELSKCVEMYTSKNIANKYVEAMRKI